MIPYNDTVLEVLLEDGGDPIYVDTLMSHKVL